jgi:hypothetical protein
MDTSFDPTRAVAFDLARGQVTLQGGATVLVSADVLAELCSGLDESALRRFGAALGKHAGGRVRARLSAGPPPTLDVMVDHLGGELSLGGFGSFGMERWGDALVVKVDGCPLGSASATLMSAYVEAALRAVAGRDVHAPLLEQGDKSFRLLLCNEVAKGKLSGWLSGGRSFGDALAALHQNPRNDVAGGGL